LQIFSACVSLREREDRKILCKDKNFAAVDESVPVDDAVAWKFLLLQPEIGRAVKDKFYRTLKTALVEKKIETLACGHFPPPFAFHPRRAAASSAARERSLSSWILISF